VDGVHAAMEDPGIAEFDPTLAEELAQQQLQTLIASVPHLARAAQVLAVPDWFDDQVAMRVLTTAGLDGAAPYVLSALKVLPFVHRHEGGWAYTEYARRYFTDQLLNGNGRNLEEFKDLNLSIATHLASQLHRNLVSDARQVNGRLRRDAFINRELHLRSLNHFMPSHGEVATGELLKFHQLADKQGIIADQRATEVICHRHVLFSGWHRCYPSPKSRFRFSGVASGCTGSFWAIRN